MLDSLCVFLSTGLGTGLLSAWAAQKAARLQLFNIRKNWTGSGLIGTIVAAILVAGGLRFEGWIGAAVLLGLTLISFPIAGRAERHLGNKDDQRINLDEILGFFWTIAFLPIDALSDPRRRLVLILAFILFRAFDVFKFPSKRVQNLTGGLGIMMDDILSGVTANLILRGLIYFWA